ncbi:UNVERIFIED_CONTAM: hypothetical protein Sradi_2520200 [Sesamum radiatum]|uniref:Reverse transcriptase domain-containing protein n=1 Tax=Sesamum radiatum TaxID=300843 RepID=A0AAW2SLH8_SESRA
MEVDIPNKESNKNFPQQEDQRGAVPARVQSAEELLSIQLVLGEPDRITKTTNDLIGIDPSIVVHSLNVDPTFLSVKLKKRHFGPEKDKIIQEELVDSTSGHELLSLMDASQGYHQIMLNLNDEKRLGRNIEVYVDDMLVKIRQMDQHLVDLPQTFGTLRRFHMKLNPAKCAFGVRSGKFLGYLVIEKGINVNPEKIQAI